MEIPDRVEPLRSLLAFQGHNMMEIPEHLFVKLKHLCILNLSGTVIQYLPNFIGDLARLRYLDLSNTPIVELPDTFSNLQYLQTLNLSGFFEFTKLPNDFSRVRSLRHFHVESQRCIMPEEIGTLTDLQTLWEFRIHDKDSEGVLRSIIELRTLSELRYLAIEGLDECRAEQR
ncbi:hypothetical protein QJS04_geneDACA007954 [Acorus gramineus]|uniref:Disease resistance R13L4/SHOC-2-like LRR domain-containing protein n=1 Tax=Acorus gramineus TaxID=55184 RepID=A0AAV9B845_ACOGR|nr:hypothetical protein QJS04_geneDACA007954 [Acorus gramineus]